MKGTQAVIDAWERHRLPWPLTVVHGTEVQVKAHGTPNVNVVGGRIPPAMLVEMQRSRHCHVQPSEYEGFGHVIHEGLSLGAAVVTSGRCPARTG